MTTATKMADDTRISEIVTGPRAVKHLEAAGIGSLGDLRAKGMEVVFTTKYVGQVAIRELQAAIGPQEKRPVATPSSDPLSEMEEGSHPINLERLPGGPARISWLPSNKVSTGVTRRVRWLILCSVCRNRQQPSLPLVMKWLWRRSPLLWKMA